MTGTVTAGNSSGVNDGAAALLLVEAERAQVAGPQADRVRRGRRVRGRGAVRMGMGPVPAIRKALERAEIARRSGTSGSSSSTRRSRPSRSRASRELGIDDDTLNVNGGAIAIGHPLGCSGARWRRRSCTRCAARGVERGGASLCVGVGQGLATIFERRRENENRSLAPRSGHPASAIFSNPSPIAATSASISTSVIGVESVAVQVLIMTKPSSKR
jgi:acetyl-CoA acetyltransferase